MKIISMKMFEQIIEQEEQCVTKEFIFFIPLFLRPFDQLRVSSCDRVIASPGCTAVCMSCSVETGPEWDKLTLTLTSPPTKTLFISPVSLTPLPLSFSLLYHPITPVCVIFQTEQTCPLRSGGSEVCACMQRRVLMSTYVEYASHLDPCLKKKKWNVAKCTLRCFYGRLPW